MAAGLDETNRAPTSVSGIVTHVGAPGADVVEDVAARPTPKPAAPISRLRAIGAAAMVAAGVAAMGLIPTWTLRSTLRHAAGEPMSARELPPVHAPEPAPNAPAQTLKPTPPGHGTLTTEMLPPGHRIFVDGRLVGFTPQPVDVKCGEHRVRIGTGGNTTVVDVPCGGAIAVSSPR